MRLASLVADPVDVSTGAHVLTRTVMQIDGALSLGVNLNYSSRDPLDRGVGFGWSHSYQMQMVVESDGSLTIYWPTGRITRYQTPTNGLYRNIDGDSRDEMRSIANGYELIDERHSRYTFTGSGELTQQRNKTGLAINYSYSSGRLSTVTEPLSARSIHFSYNGSNRLSTISADDAGSVTLSYDSNGNLVTITDAMNASEQFSYDANHRILTGTDPLNVIFFSNTYDVQGRVIEQEDGRTGNLAGTFTYTDNGNGTTTQVYSDRTGATKTYVHDSQYRLTALTDELGYTSRYTYDVQGNRISETDANGNTTHYYYDINGNLIRAANPFGDSTHFSFDESDDLVSITGPDGTRTTFSYDSNHRLTATSDPSGAGTTTEYDSDGLVIASTNERGGRTTYTLVNGQPQSVTDSTNHSVSMTYDNAGRVRTLTDGDSNATQYQYDLKGRAVKTINPLSQETVNVYDAKGRLISHTNARGYITTYSYDNNDKLIAETNSLNGVTRYTYDGEDRVKTITDALNQVTATFTYDAKGQVTSITDALNRTTHFGYDKVGNQISATDPANQTSQSRYDALNRVIEEIDALNREQRYSYDQRGNLSSHTAPGERQSQYNYDAVGRLTKTTDPLGGTVKQEFDAAGQRIRLVDPNNQPLQLSYDSEGRLLKVTTADGHFWQASYTSRGEMAQLINARSHVSQYAYDKVQRLSETSESGSVISYSYDANGNRTQVTTEQGIWSYSYDALDRLTSHTDHNGQTLQYGYDAIGQLKTLTYPDGKIVNYSYDAAGQLTQVTDWANRTTRYSYVSLGRLQTTNHSNGLATHYSYDSGNQLLTKRTVDASGQELIRYDYSYDSRGQLIQESGFDSLQPIHVGASMSYGHDNILTTFNNQKLSYDADGNMTNGWLQGAVQSFSYDNRNRLTQVGTTNYHYNSDNHRIARIQNGSEARYVINPLPSLEQVLMETNGSNTPTAWNVYGLGLIGRQHSDGSYHTYHYDYRGSTIALTNSSGAISDRYYYSPFGQRVGQQGTTEQPFAYNGRDGVLTDGNDLYYMRARYYNPDFGRFINRDLLLGNPTQSQSINRYAYVQGNPVMAIDPTGETIESVNRAFFGAMKSSAEPLISDLQLIGGVGEGIAKKWYRNLVEPSAYYIQDTSLPEFKRDMDNLIMNIGGLGWDGLRATAWASQRAWKNRVEIGGGIKDFSIKLITNMDKFPDAMKKSLKDLVDVEAHKERVLALYGGAEYLVKGYMYMVDNNLERRVGNAVGSLVYGKIPVLGQINKGMFALDAINGYGKARSAVYGFLK